MRLDAGFIERNMPQNLSRGALSSYADRMLFFNGATRVLIVSPAGSRFVLN